MASCRASAIDVLFGAKTHLGRYVLLLVVASYTQGAQGMQGRQTQVNKGKTKLLLCLVVETRLAVTQPKYSKFFLKCQNQAIFT